MTTNLPAISGLFAAAQAARQRGDRAEEARLIDAVLQQQPDNPQALNSRGMHALSDGDYRAAEQYFLRASAADPGEPALWMNVASARRAQGDMEGEDAALAAVLAIDRRHFMGLLRLAELQQRQDRLAAAAATWANVLKMAPAIDPMPSDLADVLARAQTFVAGRNRDFAVLVDAGLSDAAQGLPSRETRRIMASVDHILGRRSAIYPNICSGLHVPFLPADEFFERDHFPWMAALEAKTALIRAELEALMAGGGAPLRPYVQQDSGTPQNKWSALDGSLDWGACFLWEYGVRNEAVCDLCPETAAALEALPRTDIPGRAPSAFFSLLKPHTRIPAHTGVTNSRTIIHLPLIVPPGCGFRVGGETREWVEGECLAFDDTIEHEAWNESDALRAVLIFDVWNPHLTPAEQQLLKQFFHIADMSGNNPAA